MQKRLILLGWLLLAGLGAQAQKEVASSTNVWFMMMNEFRLSPNWYLSNEVHIRRADGISNWQQFLLRPAINYRIGSSVELAAGYSYILTYPYGEQPLLRRVPENNIWQQLLVRHSAGRFGLLHRLRLEERWVGKVVTDNQGDYQIEGNNYRQRIRYRLAARLPLLKIGEQQRELFVTAFDELFLHLDESFESDAFNQNWVYVGFGYQLNQFSNIQAGYLDQLIRKPGGLRYEHNPTINLAFFYNFNLYSRQD